MYTNFSLEEVIAAVDDFLVKSGLSDNTLSRYRRFGFNYFRDGFSAEGCYFYSEELAESLVAKFHQQVLNGQRSERDFRTIRKVHELMKEHVKNGKILYHDLPFWNIQYPCNELKEALVRYLASMEQSGYSELTIREANSIIRLFLLHMELKGKHTLDCFSAEDIENYLPVLRQKWSSGMSNPIYYLRGFFAFLYERQEIRQDLSLVLKVNAASKIKVKTGFEANEIEAILTAIDRSTPLGKRNFAMITLAVHSGLRQIDVLNLKLQDIHWKDAEISIVQRKTNRQLILPLDQETGDAIADYLLHGRPTSKSTFVFLRSVAPYTNLKVGSCIGSRIVQKYAALSGVVWTTKERKGFHSFRRSLGRELLENDVPVCTISEILGHANRNSTKQYLSVDVKHLRECALPLNELRCTKEALL